jgi:hypothetical protein
MVKVRNSLGRYISNAVEIADLQKPPIDAITQRVVIKLLLVILAVMLLSPWLYIFYKGGAFLRLTDRVGDFYADNFSCNSYQLDLERTKEQSNNRNNSF